jgi:hypothetical protein
MHEVLGGGELDVADEVLAPDDVNVAMAVGSFLPA